MPFSDVIFSNAFSVLRISFLISSLSIFLLQDVKRTIQIIKIKNDIPTGKFQEPEEIANFVMFLCSEYNQSITGQLISIDGGFLCK